jgi:hypothetical protein
MYSLIDIPIEIQIIQDLIIQNNINNIQNIGKTHQDKIYLEVIKIILDGLIIILIKTNFAIDIHNSIPNNNNKKINNIIKHMKNNNFIKSKNITHNIINYWYRSLRSPVYLYNQSQFWLNNNFSELQWYNTNGGNNTLYSTYYGSLNKKIEYKLSQEMGVKHQWIYQLFDAAIKNYLIDIDSPLLSKPRNLKTLIDCELVHVSLLMEELEELDEKIGLRLKLMQTLIATEREKMKNDFFLSTQSKQP